MRYIYLPAGLFLIFLLTTTGCGTPAHHPDANGPHAGIAFSPPSVTALSPSSAPVDSVPFTIQVNGTNFGTDAIVFWNGTPLSTRFVNSTQLLANLTSSNLMLAGMINVYVRTGGSNSNTVQFDLH